MKTSISAELRGSYALNPFHFLPGSFTIFCFHSWLQNHLFLPICTSRPDTEPNTNPSNHPGGKLKSSVSMFSAVHGVYVYESYGREAEFKSWSDPPPPQTHSATVIIPQSSHTPRSTSAAWQGSASRTWRCGWLAMRRMGKGRAWRR